MPRKESKGMEGKDSEESLCFRLGRKGKDDEAGKDSDERIASRG